MFLWSLAPLPLLNCFFFIKIDAILNTNADSTFRLPREEWDMKKVLVFCVLTAFWLSLAGTSVWAIDVGWMQKGVRVWYFGSAGSGTSSDAEEAYLFASINGNNAQLTHHSGLNHWTSPNGRHKHVFYYRSGTYLDISTGAPKYRGWRQLDGHRISKR